MIAAPLHVAVEASRLTEEVRGIGRYVRAMLPRLVAGRPGVRLTLFVKPRDVGPMDARLGAVEPLAGRVDVREERALRRADADVFWFPWNLARPAPPDGAPVVVTVHDVAPLVFPGRRLRDWRGNRKWRRRYRDTAERATLIITDSTFTATELHRLLGVPHDRMRVVPLAADDADPAPPEGDAAALRRLEVTTPFVLAVGADETRKNLGLLDAAMPAARAAARSLSLVLAGPRRDGAGVEPPWKRTLGFVSDAELAALYRAAVCVVVPSSYEGFGLPVLEAMRHGAPVVCARTSSLPEVGGDAVVWVSPDDPAELARAITRLARADAPRSALRDAGRARAALFSWDETARRTLVAFDEAARLR